MSKNKVIEITGDSEIVDLFVKLYERILQESGRGAVLIATTYVEEFLTRLITEVLPNKEKRVIAKLFEYPGPISIFAAKIELSYSFRLIGSRLYKSLNALRKIRNDAAHDNSHFSLKDLNDKMHSVYALGPDIPVLVKELALKLMINAKLESLKGSGIDFQNEEIRKNVIEEISSESSIEMLKNQAPHWELMYGICLICAYIKYEMTGISDFIKRAEKWSDLVNLVQVVDETKFS